MAAIRQVAAFFGAGDGVYAVLLFTKAPNLDNTPTHGRSQLMMPAEAAAGGDAGGTAIYGRRGDVEERGRFYAKLSL